MDFGRLEKLARLIRRDILVSTTEAGSGHATSALSAVELATVLFFAGFLDENDHFILSKGHASPLLYSVYHAAGLISDDELKSLRQIDSNLEGHPTPRFPYVEVATGSLGQGLSMGLGMVLGMKKKREKGKVFVLLGDSEFAEGQNYEALQLAFHYRANDLIGILDVNRLGQRGETMAGWNLTDYQQKVSAFGWETVVVDDGNSLHEVQTALDKALVLSSHGNRPVMIIARTVKGKGVSFLENEDGWHGKPLSKDQLAKALQEFGEVDSKIHQKIPLKQAKKTVSFKVKDLPVFYEKESQISTREAYGDGLQALGKVLPETIALDAEVSNSTFSEKFQKKYPQRFFEMFIAEQNMISVAVGMSKMGLLPFVSTFAAFFSRGFDQIRMAQYGNANIKLCGSHAGVSIGQDGPSQMGLEDLAIMRSVLESVVLYPSDGQSTAQMVRLMAEHNGIVYLRTTREKTPVIYDSKEKFEVGGAKVLKQSDEDKAVVFAAGVTVHEALKAYEKLQRENIDIAIVDLYSVKPLDEETVRQLSRKVKNVVVVEDHYPAGGLGEAVKSTLTGFSVNLNHLAVTKTPRSGKPEELLRYEEIDSTSILASIRNLLE